MTSQYRFVHRQVHRHLIVYKFIDKINSLYKIALDVGQVHINNDRIDHYHHILIITQDRGAKFTLITELIGQNRFTFDMQGTEI